MREISYLNLDHVPNIDNQHNRYKCDMNPLIHVQYLHTTHIILHSKGDGLSVWVPY